MKKIKFKNGGSIELSESDPLEELQGIKSNPIFVPKDESDGISVVMWEEAGPFTKKMADQLSIKKRKSLRNVSALSSDKSKPFLEIFFGKSDT